MKIYLLLLAITFTTRAEKQNEEKNITLCTLLSDTQEHGNSGARSIDLERDLSASDDNSNKRSIAILPHVNYHTLITLFHSGENKSDAFEIGSQNLTTSIKHNTQISNFYASQTIRRCSIRLEACINCIIGIQFKNAYSYFSSSHKNKCHNDNTLPRNKEKRPCLDFIIMEEHADGSQTLYSKTGMFLRESNDQTSYQRVSIWDDQFLDRNDINKFNSTSSSLIVIVMLRNVEEDAQLLYYVEHILFPVHVRVYDNSEIIRGSTLNKKIGIIESPRFPLSYPRVLFKNYTIINENQCGFIRITFNDFYIHFLSELRILDSNNTEIFNTKHRHRRPPTLISSANRLSLLFNAGSFTRPIGFSIQYEFVDAYDWHDIPDFTDCDEYLESFGGTINLNMRIQLIGRRVDCIWLISRPFIGRVGPSMHAVAADHELYLRVEEFALHGDSLHFEIRRGATSLSPLVIEFVGEQTRSHLSKILPTNGFISSLSVNDSMGHNNMAAAFYIRLRGHIINNKGLSIVFSHFYRWATALCPGVREFHCDNARCIKSSLRCDGVDHCGDQSEEVACRDAASAMSNVELFNLPSLLTIAVAIVSAALVFALLSILISVARNRILFCLSGRSFFPNNSIHNRNVSSGGSSIEDRCHNGRNRNYTYSNNININDENEEPNVMTTQFSQHSSVTAYQNHMGNGRPPGSTPLRNTPNSEMFFASRMPLIQTIGNRRFYIFPPNNQLNVIEAPPTYDDALKHCAIMNTNIAQNNHTNRLCDQNVTNIDNNYDRYNDNTEEILNNIINNTSNADNCISNVTNECEIRIPTGRQRSSSYNFLSQSLPISHHQRSLSS